MSLLKRSFEECVLLSAKNTDDGMGGYTVTWTDDTPFSCAIVLKSDTAISEADRSVSVSEYIVTTTKDFILKEDDVFRRLSDSKTFIVTTNRYGSTDTGRLTPDSSSLNMRQVTAKEWKK